MRSLLVSESDTSGGAARATFRLHRSLQLAGVQSAILVRRRLSDDPAVQQRPHGNWSQVSRVRTYVDAGLSRLQRSTNEVYHSGNLLPTRWAKWINARGVDVVNLHWIGKGTLSIEDVSRINLPTVMTLHDMWGFCGAEHYASEAGDARWRVGYRRDNRDDGNAGPDIDRWVWQRKRRHWKPMPVVCPSRWLAECAQQSVLMRDWPVHVIPNALDTTVFQPADQTSARRALGLPIEGSLVLFGAIGGGKDPRKGFDLLMDAFATVEHHRSGVTGVVFGEDEPANPRRMGVPIRWMGPIHGDTTLALLYNAADVVVVPSRQDNLPQVATEAQSCGTPVVAFDVSGLRDTVLHRVTGYLAQPFSTDELAAGIVWTLADERRGAELGRHARDHALRRWAPSVVARQYLEVFQEAVDQYAAPARD